MTSASAKRPSPNMKTATRPSRFSNLTMANGGRDDKSPQPISSSFASPWQTPGAAGIWNSAGPSLNPIGSAFNPIKRDPTTSRGPDEHFPNGPTGSSALASTSEADWPTRSSAPWNPPDHPQTRPTSGNTSPNRARDAGSSSLNDIANSPAYLASRGPANYTGLPKASGSLDSGSTFKYGPGFNEVQDEKDGSAPFGARVNSRFDADPGMRGYNRADKRPQDGFLNVVGGPSRDNSLPPSRHSEAEQHQTGYVDGMNGFSPFGSNTPSSGLAQRSSLPNHSASFASQVNSRAFAVNNQVPDEDLNAKFARSVTIQDSLEGASSSIPSFPNGTAAGFQFNPGSQPWNGETKPYANGYNPETYVDQISGPYIPMKLGSGDRGSPSGSQYRSTVSPKAFTSTPPSGVDAWSRPSSRDHRMAQDLERNRPGQPPFLPQQPAAFYPQPFYANYPPPYPSHLYDPFASTGHPGFRQPLALTQYLPVPPYLAGAAGVPLRAAKDQDHSKGIRSVVLEEFRASGKTNKKFELKDIYNHVVEFSGDQHGSRFIQAKLEGANSDEKDQVFREIEPNAVQLMKDVFGNYVIQKFFEHGNQVQKKILAGVMKNKMVDLSCQMYSCRVVQKAMEHVLVEQQAELVKELEPEVIRIIKDQNGNHVIQKVIEVVPGRYTRFIMDALRGSIREMASHSYGCRVIQRLMEHGSEEDKAAIMSEIHVCSTMLVVDQYGNYVTQHVLQHGKPEDRHRMIEIVVPQLLQLSKHKFASNVVEKCIEYGSDEDRQLILNKIYEKGQDGNSALQLMVKDQYGNYVIQKCLNSLQGAERVKFVDELRPIVVSLKKASTGRQTAALEKLLQACDGEQSKASETVMPAGPGLQIDAQSASQTPALTMEPNTPQSSNPPSTHNSTVGEGVSDTSKTQMNGVGSEAPSVQVSDA